MKRLVIYTDASVIGGCEDSEYQAASLALWQRFIQGTHTLALSAHTLREIQGAPEAVRKHLRDVPEQHQLVFPDSQEASDLAEAYLRHGVVGPGSRADALHVALASAGRTDVLVSWNFKHIVNLGRIRLFQAVNIENGYGSIEIRTPREVIGDEEGV
ncbi:MAG: PIN domain protein [Candidatus Coatesbacteria bacterium]